MNKIFLLISILIIFLFNQVIKLNANDDTYINSSNIIYNEKENIVVWLDFDGYAYLNFGIIIELAKLNKFNFIGIVTTKQDISFFQNQKIIPFKKLIYYPDCYINKQNYNLKNCDVG